MKYKTSGGWEIIPLLNFFVHAYLIRNGRTAMLLDTGRRSMRGRLLRQLQQQGVENLLLLMLTHSHFDHTENAAFIKEKFGARVLIHQLEAGFLNEGKSNTIRGTHGLFRWLTLTFSGRISGMYRYEPVIQDIAFADEYVIPETQGQLKCIHIPGHTPGSSALIVDGEIALVGDAFAHHLPGSIFPPFGEDRRKILDSWQTLIDQDCRLYLPSHGKAVTKERLKKELSRKRQ